MEKRRSYLKLCSQPSWGKVNTPSISLFSTTVWPVTPSSGEKKNRTGNIFVVGELVHGNRRADESSWVQELQLPKYQLRAISEPCKVT